MHPRSDRRVHEDRRERAGGSGRYPAAGEPAAGADRYSSREHTRRDREHTRRNHRWRRLQRQPYLAHERKLADHTDRAFDAGRAAAAASRYSGAADVVAGRGRVGAGELGSTRFVSLVSARCADGAGRPVSLGALEDPPEGMSFVQARHEELAAFMARAHAMFIGEVIHLFNGLYDARGITSRWSPSSVSRRARPSVATTSKRSTSSRSSRTWRATRSRPACIRGSASPRRLSASANRRWITDVSEAPTAAS